MPSRTLGDFGQREKSMGPDGRAHMSKYPHNELNRNHVVSFLYAQTSAQPRGTLFLCLFSLPMKSRCPIEAHWGVLVSCHYGKPETVLEAGRTPCLHNAQQWFYVQVISLNVECRNSKFDLGKDKGKGSDQTSSDHPGSHSKAKKSSKITTMSVSANV